MHTNSASGTADLDTSENKPVGTLITLPEWAEQIGRSVESVRSHLVGQEGFPEPKGTRPRTGSGTPYKEYDSDELAKWLARWEAGKYRPAPLPMPQDPDEYRTLGAIAKLLHINGKTVSQYRDIFDTRVKHEDRGARRYYHTRAVIDVLNSRRGYGVALDPSTDKRFGGRT
jgi:hypothetical protein